MSFFRSNTPVDPIFSLKYCINFNLFLYDCIPLTLLVIKLKINVWEHEIIKTLTGIQLQNTDKKLNKKNICSKIIKTEMLLYKREVVILLNIVLDFKSKHIIKGESKKAWNASRICVSSLSRGHANLLCIVPILIYVLP